MNIFDSHSHYSDNAFNSDRDEVLKSFPSSGIRYVVGCGSSLESSKMEIELANKYDFYYAAVGIHPEDADSFDEEALKQIRSLSLNGKVVAIGEIGLDYHYEDNPDKEIQKKAFAEQMKLANELSLPVIIHSRDATEDTLNLVKEYRPCGVVHCFSGSVETMNEYISLGMYIGFTGVVTFKNSKKACKAAEMVPIDRILVETDCPYMAPEPYRGTRCDSRMLTSTISAIAGLKGMDPLVLADMTLDNAKRMFSIK